MGGASTAAGETEVFSDTVWDASSSSDLDVSPVLAEFSDDGRVCAPRVFVLPGGGVSGAGDVLQVRSPCRAGFSLRNRATRLSAAYPGDSGPSSARAPSGAWPAAS